MKRILVLLGIGVGVAAVLWGATSITTDGDVQANAFIGDGAQLTNVDAPGTALDTRLDNAETLLLMVQDQLHHSLLCRGGALRYLDLGDGTVWDCQQNLQWLKDANCWGQASWDWAMGTALNQINLGVDYCEAYTGRYKDWRLPTKSEWEAAVADGNALSPQCSNPALTSNGGARQVDDLPDDGDTGAWVGTCASTGPFAFSGVVSSFYWSSSTYASSTNGAWLVSMASGDVYDGSKSSTGYVWPVRGGQ